MFVCAQGGQTSVKLLVTIPPLCSWVHVLFPLFSAHWELVINHDVTRANVQPAASRVQLECINVKSITVEIRAWLRVCYSHVPRSVPTQPCRDGDRVATYLLTCWEGRGVASKGQSGHWTIIDVKLEAEECKRNLDLNSLARLHRSDTILFYTTLHYLKPHWLLTPEIVDVLSGIFLSWHGSEQRHQKWSEHIRPNLSSSPWEIRSDLQKQAPKN